jgi:hypothetical protein
MLRKTNHAEMRCPDEKNADFMQLLQLRLPEARSPQLVVMAATL